MIFDIMELGSCRMQLSRVKVDYKSFKINKDITF